MPSDEVAHKETGATPARRSPIQIVRSQAGVDRFWRRQTIRKGILLSMLGSTKFNERKATQVAARFLAAAGNRMHYIKLLKMMYMADREALARWGCPLTNDKYFSLDYGPILSAVKNLMVEEPQQRSFWNDHISSPSKYQIELIDEAGSDELSRAEENLVDEIFNKYRRMDRWQLIEKSHELPEWQDPQGSSIPIEIADILQAVGKQPQEIDDIVRDLSGLRKMQALSIE